VRDRRRRHPSRTPPDDGRSQPSHTWR
jgi:hypothetical protein